VIDAAAERPVLVEPLPENTTTLHGGSATFFCRVRSYTAPHVQVFSSDDVVYFIVHSFCY